MEHVIPVTIRDKIATYNDKRVYICGNSGFSILFDFDSEWDEYEAKTARFTYNGIYQDVVFSGNECPVPVLSDTYSFKIGVYAGNLKTTTAAYIPAKKSILCGGGSPAKPAESVYAQIMEMLNDIYARLEALEEGGYNNTSTSLLGSAVLGNMILGG